MKETNFILTPKQVSDHWGVPTNTLRKWSYIKDKDNWRYTFYRKLHDIALYAYLKSGNYKIVDDNNEKEV